MSFTEFSEGVADGLRMRIADSHPKLTRGKVWCTVCGQSMGVDSAYCLKTGWPKCCGYTMTIDSPEERITAVKPTEGA